jgi:D-alanyl-D-alanine carboxypeptidase
MLDGKPMRPDVALAFDRMAAATRREAGLELLVSSGFRSDAEQARLWAAKFSPARPSKAPRMPYTTSVQIASRRDCERQTRQFLCATASRERRDAPRLSEGTTSACRGWRTVGLLHRQAKQA